MAIKRGLFALTVCLGIVFGFQLPAVAAKDKRHNSASSEQKIHKFKHNILLQLSDFYGVPVENTEFWVTVDVVKVGSQVTLHLPTINFQVGQCSFSNPYCPDLPPFGYIYTAGGFLPEDCRPSGLVPVSVNATSNNGLTDPFYFEEIYLPPDLVAPTGYIVQVTNAGALQIQGTGTFGNLLSEGPQTVMPCAITYLAEKREQICSNFKISDGFTNVVDFTGPTPHGTPAGDNIRDSHLVDAYKDTVVWAWCDNHNVDKNANILNVFVAVGKVDKKGKLKVSDPIQITDFPTNTIAWDTSVAINRNDTSNIVVSYEMIPYDFSQTYFDGNIVGTEVRNCRAVSFDGGKSFGGVYNGSNVLTYNGPLNYQPPGGQGSGDYPGIKADKYGNFWICTTNFSDGSGNLVNVPYLLNSADMGITWNLAYSLPPVINPQPPTPDGGTTGDLYDYPHIVFGTSGSQYGIYIYSDYIVDEITSGDLFPAVSFVPINGLANFGAGITSFLNALPNVIAVPSIAASMDGRFWAFGHPNFTTTFIPPLGILYKSPGDLGENYAGLFTNGFVNQEQLLGSTVFQDDSVPFYGYFPSVDGLIYDEKRAALYALYAANSPDFSQNMRLYLMISRNNGLTWSRPFDIATSNFANRGFSAMAVDPKSGNLFVGWYDGRKDKEDLQNIQYYGAMVKACDLDRLVNEIPLSNPFFLIPDQGSPDQPDSTD